MTKHIKPSIKKPVIDAEAARAFAEGAAGQERKTRGTLPPDGDVRLNANIRRELHLRIKIEAARQGKSIGQLIEELIDAHIPRA